MKGNPVQPGGLSMSKPARRNARTAFRRAGLFFAVSDAGRRQPPGITRMSQSTTTRAQQIARAVRAFEQRRTGQKPEAVNVVLSEDTLVITLHGALSPAEKALAKNPEGAAQLREYHRALFHNSSDWLRQEIKRITGVEVREASVEVETTTGAVVQSLDTGAVVQVFLLARSVPADAWSERGSDNVS